MVSNDSSPQGDVKADAAGNSVPVLDPRKPIEVANQGGGTTTDPAGSDNQPPPIADPAHYD